MTIPTYWPQALAELSQGDPVMAVLIQRFDQLSLVSRGDPFATLARSIVGQQISVKAADAVWARFVSRVEQVSPEIILAHGLTGLAGCGLSGRKVEYMCDLAAHFVNGQLNPALWAELDDEALIQELTKVRGIGRWTAEMFIHPLLGPDDSWSGYCVEFASTAPSLDALNGLINSPILQSFDLRHPWLIPAIPGTTVKTPLGDRAVSMFTAEPSPENTEALAELEANLRQSRCQVGLTASPKVKLPSTGAWNYLAISCSHARSLPPYTLLGLSSRTTIVATEIQSHNDHQWAQANACSLSTTEFIHARPTTGKKADMTRVKLLELLALIVDDADTSTLEAIFRQEPKLSYSLLRLVNSAAISPRSPITSFAQAINLLGRRQLQRWLQLLVYADPNDGQRPNPLLQKAAARGRQMELLVSKLNPRPEIDDLEDAAFMIGTFSLLDVLLNMPIKEVLQHLPLNETVSNALAEYAGGLEQLLAAINAAESRELALATKRIERLAISGDDYRDAQLTALSWAASIRSAS